MTHKIYDKQGNIYFLMGSTTPETGKAKPLCKSNKLKKLAALLGETLNIQLHDQQLSFLLGYTNYKNNHAAIMAWLSENNIEDEETINFQELYSKLVSELTNATETSSSL